MLASEPLGSHVRVRLTGLWVRRIRAHPFSNSLIADFKARADLARPLNIALGSAKAIEVITLNQVTHAKGKSVVHAV